MDFFTFIRKSFADALRRIFFDGGDLASALTDKKKIDFFVENFGKYAEGATCFETIDMTVHNVIDYEWVKKEITSEEITMDFCEFMKEVKK